MSFLFQNCLLLVKDSGKKLKDLFEEKIRVVSNPQFFSFIKQQALKNFEFHGEKIKLKKGDNEKQIAAQRRIIGMLISTSHKTKSALNFEASMV